MTPETKKTLIYGGVISFAVGAGLYIWSRYQNNGTATGDGGAAAAAQAQADAAATNQETQLAELQALSGGGGSSLPSISLGGGEAPHDNFSQEIAQILQAAGLGTPASTPTGTAPPPASSPTNGLPQPTPPPKVESGAPAIHQIGPEPGPGTARTFDHILADPANYPSTIQ